jgi:hypothetical protein
LNDMLSFAGPYLLNAIVKYLQVTVLCAEGIFVPTVTSRIVSCFGM